MLQENADWLSFRPSCPFAQKKCINKPPLVKVKQHEFACHFPINFREQNLLKNKTENTPFVVAEIAEKEAF
ncbi:antimicrobial peptide ABC transporter ATP-binding protein [Mannheimia haemolytica]|uniref:Antimicrobial peptide ABC transporter ATP-binding protein n=1 Tax=Mannheimia haemolytica TaxID=75985 RepID=A0A378N0R7_MANHA|nr:antimicrobial peptide ABC transporter ATP-binding protein [Mannheimia haemolytica]